MFTESRPRPICMSNDMNLWFVDGSLIYSLMSRKGVLKVSQVSKQEETEKRSLKLLQDARKKRMIQLFLLLPWRTGK
jgi:hypothetical protein